VQKFFSIVAFVDHVKKHLMRCQVKTEAKETSEISNRKKRKRNHSLEKPVSRFNITFINPMHYFQIDQCTESNPSRLQLMKQKQILNPLVLI
jgi:hypothetical protein